MKLNNIKGNIKVKVKVWDLDSVPFFFDFSCYVDSALDGYDVFSYIDNIAFAMVKLRNLSLYVIVDFERLD